jgi:hypothetical protein
MWDRLGYLDLHPWRIEVFESYTESGKGGFALLRYNSRQVATSPSVIRNNGIAANFASVFVLASVIILIFR